MTFPRVNEFFSHNVLPFRHIPHPPSQSTSQEAQITIDSIATACSPQKLHPSPFLFWQLVQTQKVLCAVVETSKVFALVTYLNYENEKPNIHLPISFIFIFIFQSFADDLCSPPQPQARILIAITDGIKKQKEKYLIDAGINS